MNLKVAFLVVQLLIPAGLMAGRASTYNLSALPDSGLVAGTAIEIIEHNGGVWMATGKGIVYSFDNGATWLVYDRSNGLVSDDISALFSNERRLWTATNHVELIEDELTTVSDGISFTDDDGLNWIDIDFNSSGQSIPFVTGGNRTIFDISGYVDPFFSSRSGETVEWMFFSAFAGGLLASYDNGSNWRRIFASPSDSIQFTTTSLQPSLRNRSFSCAADSTHGDTLMLWSGTAGGLFQYIYAPPREKLFSRVINRMELCAICGDSTGSRLFLGGNNGLSYTSVGGGNVVTGFESEGLPAREITGIFQFGSRLMAAVRDTLTGLSAGLVYSDDNGTSFISVADVRFTGIDSTILGFAAIDTRLYLAASQSGFFESLDSGITWSRILIDSVNMMSVYNHINALASLGDTLYAGTDSGFAAIYLSPAGLIDSMLITPFIEDSANAAGITLIRVQEFANPITPLVIDSVALWAIAQPVTSFGVPALYRSNDGGSSWQLIQAPVSYDVNFVGDTVFVVGELGIRLSFGGGDANTIFSARQFVNDSIEVANLNLDTVTAMVVSGDTIIFGTRNGFAISTDRGAKFTITRPNLDSLAADVIINYTALNTFDLVRQVFGISGDFIPAIGVQYQAGGPANIWVSGRVVDFGGDGIAVGRYLQLLDTLTGDSAIILKWETSYFDGFAWNFAFSGDSTFAATNGGLLLHTGDFTPVGIAVWDTVALVDATTGIPLIDDDEPIFAVRRIGNYLWVGTGDGTIRIDLLNLNDQKLFQVVDSTSSPDEVYAFPVPFRPRQQTLDFHFVVEQDGPVTIEVYDFAMTLVARPIDGLFYTAGIYPNGMQQGMTWDGRNNKGDFVAVGVYYFRVVQENGAARWGKLAVIP